MPPEPTSPAPEGGSLEPGAWAGLRGHAPAAKLHVCVDCLATRVYALDWRKQEDPTDPHAIGIEDPRWRVLLRCPDCGGTREGLFEQDLVEALSDELERAMSSILNDLRLLTTANMQAEFDFLARALRDDLIGPGDFAQR